jgi:hypothetical protein
MNINEMIEQEIKNQVEAKTAALRSEFQAEYDAKLTEAKTKYKNLLKSKILRIFEEEEIVAQKCNYHDCKNYGDGSIDPICSGCDSYKIKKEKDKKCEENLSESAAAKSTLKKAVEKIVADTEAKSEDTKETNTKNEKDIDLFNETVEAISPFFELFGISKDDIFNAKEKMNDPKVKAEAESLAKALGLKIYEI